MKANTREILKECKELLKQNLGDHIQEVILFGSQSTGTISQISDIDLLIIVKDHSIPEREISDICFQLDLKYNIFLDIHILSKKDLESRKGNQPIFINAIENGIYA